MGSFGIATVDDVKAVLCVDVEPDARMPDPVVSMGWLGAERLFDDHDWLRSRLGGQAINWFLRLDHQIEHLHGDIGWAAERFADDLHELIDSGDEVGAHPHNWRWTGVGWLPDGTTSWVVENAERSLAAYAAAFGVGPPSFRFGDRFVCDDVVRLLIGHPDVKVDLTTEPGVRASRGLVEAEKGQDITRHVDAQLARRYRPDRGMVDISSDSGDLTMVPLTVAALPGSGTVDTLTLWRTPDEFDRMLRVRLLDRQLDHLAFAIRSDLALLPRAIAHVQTNLDTLMQCIDDLEWVRASTLALETSEPSDQGLGMIGSLATAVDDMIRVVHPEPPIVVPSLADSVRDIVERNDHLDGQLAATSAALAATECAVAAECTHSAELAEAVDAERARADDAARRLDMIEQTMLWRARTRVLPALRPVASARRLIVTRWNSRRVGNGTGAPR